MLGERLKALRIKYDYTQADAAQLIGISAPAYSAYESGKSMPSLSTAIFFAKHYNVSLDWLCGLEDANIVDKAVSAASLYAFLASLSLKDKKIFWDGKMKINQFLESPFFKRLTPQQQLYLYQEYQQQEWEKEKPDK